MMKIFFSVYICRVKAIVLFDSAGGGSSEILICLFFMAEKKEKKEGINWGKVLLTVISTIPVIIETTMGGGKKG